MEQPHSLLMLVLKQHYLTRPHIIESAKRVITNYCEDSRSNYEKTLSILYTMMNDLPPDILLYFLTMVPLPKDQEPKNSMLMGLMKQMHSQVYQNSMRPVLLQYLNEKIPPLIPISTKSAKSQREPESEKLETSKKKNIETIEEPNEEIIVSSNDKTDTANTSQSTLISVIDDNIKRDKDKNKSKKANKKSRGVQKKSFQVKSLGHICATNIYKYFKYYNKIYEYKKKELWKILDNESNDKDLISQCYTVLRDVNKKIKWLTMFKTGVVSLEIIKEEYGNSDIFFKEKHLDNEVSEDMFAIHPILTAAVRNLINRC